MSAGILTLQQLNPDRCFSRATFKTLLQLAVMDCHFIFNGSIFKQLDGVAMGSPLGPTMANVFMCHLEKLFLTNCPLEFKPSFYKRYMDDTFVLFRKPAHAQLFLSYINSFHSCIKFTMETEKDKKLEFLDVEVTSSGSHFMTSVYRKPTFTGLGQKYL